MGLEETLPYFKWRTAVADQLTLLWQGTEPPASPFPSGISTLRQNLSFITGLKALAGFHGAQLSRSPRGREKTYMAASVTHPAKGFSALLQLVRGGARVILPFLVAGQGERCWGARLTRSAGMGLQRGGNRPVVWNIPCKTGRGNRFSGRLRYFCAASASCGGLKRRTLGGCSSLYRPEMQVCSPGHGRLCFL